MWLIILAVITILIFISNTKKDDEIDALKNTIIHMASDEGVEKDNSRASYRPMYYSFLNQLNRSVVC